MQYWLFKTEPDAFSIDDLAAMPNQTEHWDGIRNYQARNFLRDQIKLGDQVFIYHSSCDKRWHCWGGRGGERGVSRPHAI